MSTARRKTGTLDAGNARSKRPSFKVWGIQTIRLEAKSTVKPGGLQQSSLPLLNVKRLNERVGNLKAEMQPKSGANSIMTFDRLHGRRIDYGNDNAND